MRGYYEKPKALVGSAAAGIRAAVVAAGAAAQQQHGRVNTER